jgi:hypothetical protein
VFGIQGVKYYYPNSFIAFSWGYRFGENGIGRASQIEHGVDEAGAEHALMLHSGYLSLIKRRKYFKNLFCGSILDLS